MSKLRKFTAEPTGPITSTEPPEWVRKMNDHYAKTGTVRAVDAARLRGDQAGALKIVGDAAQIVRNDDSDE